jgi:Fis family transcriptional regulator
MSRKQLEECVRDTLVRYFDDLRGTEPHALHEMIMNAVEKPLLELVLHQADGNQSKAAEWLGINRNTLHRKLTDHKLLK